MQAQDYAGAMWALGLRMRDASDEALDRAFAEGSILRTHVLRPTWHFVPPEDIRWLLALTAPRVHQVNGTMYRKLELDEGTLSSATDVLARRLEGGRHLTREELAEKLENEGITAPTGLRLAYTVMHAELEGLICSGPRSGKQFSSRVRTTASMSREAVRLEISFCAAELDALLPYVRTIRVLSSG